MTISAAFNIYNDALALPGLLENVTPFFDEVFCIHAGPGGRASTDGTMEILERWGIRTVMGKIDEGFGAVRTQLIREAQTDWVWIFDTDERFYPKAPLLRCEGDERYPWQNEPKLRVTMEHGVSEQGELLRTLMEYDVMSIRTSRRHWFDYTWKRPCQNWHLHPDWQLRIVKKSDGITYLTEHKMHEKLRRVSNGEEPSYASQEPTDLRGLHVDHFHCFWKAQEPEQRKEDIAIYDALHYGWEIDSPWMEKPKE